MSKNIFFLLVLPFFLLSCNAQKKSIVVENESKIETKYAKNIIFMIGDGMGTAQITTAAYMQDKPLNFERFKVIGLQKTHSASNLITDSGASATALACGVKTYTNAIGVNKDTIPVPSILEEAEARGLMTGMVVSSTIVHATPAAFIAHVPFRRDYEDIAEFFLKTEIDFFAGGGKKYFDKREKDDQNLITQLKKKNYLATDYTSRESIETMSIPEKMNFAWFAADGDPATALDGRTYLPPMSKKAIEHLSKSDEGFFLMIEGSQIDWAGHANDVNYLISEMQDFDRILDIVLDFAERDGKTLVIVTGDHECGGLTIDDYESTRKNIKPHFSTTSHSAVMLPVFAFGPGAELFSGIYDNTDIYFKMREALNWNKSMDVNQ
jgi:alkaline phosphatase